MRRTLVQCALATALALSIAGCTVSPRIHHQQLVALDKGMSPGEVVRRLNLPPLDTKLASGNGRHFTFQYYHLTNGTMLDPYFMAYEQDRLLFWGYIDEFRRQSDRDLGLALNAAIDQIRASR